MTAEVKWTERTSGNKQKSWLDLNRRWTFNEHKSLESLDETFKERFSFNNILWAFSILLPIASQLWNCLLLKQSEQNDKETYIKLMTIL